MSTEPAPPFGTWVPGNRWDLLADKASRPRTVRVVVTQYEQPDALARTLRAVERQTYPAHLVEVVVVDDGSRVEPVVPDGVALRRQEDLGFRLAAARNLGAEGATTDLLCFLDADTVPEPDFLTRLLRLPSLLAEAVVVGRRRHADLEGAPGDSPVERVGPELALAEPAWLARACEETRDLLDADGRSYRFLIGAAFACSTWMFKRTSGFDPTFDAYGGEDWEWFHRAWLEGAVFAHEPAAVAWHDGPDVIGRRGPEQRRVKNVEVLRLSRLVPVVGSRGHGIRGGRPDVVLVPPPNLDEAALFVCADSLLPTFPLAGVALTAAEIVPDSLAHDSRITAGADAARAVAEARVVLTLTLPVVLLGGQPDAVGPLLDDLTSDAPVTTLTGPDGTVLGEVVPRRARLRLARWGERAVQRTTLRWSAALVLQPEPDVEAWVGGWARAEHLTAADGTLAFEHRAPDGT